jgi:hypothetical protein
MSSRDTTAKSRRKTGKPKLSRTAVKDVGASVKADRVRGGVVGKSAACTTEPTISRSC